VNTYEKGKLYDINLNDLLSDFNQPRKVIDPQALEELTASVTRHGVLQPILFRVGTEIGGHDPGIGGHDAIVSPNSPQQPALYVVAGERRCAAARNAGLTQIPALLVEGKDSEIALVENLLRQDLTPVEEAEALQRLIEEEKYTQEQLGTMIGRARTTINESLSLNKLPKEIRDDCRGDRKLTKSALVEIARKKQSRSMVKAYNTLKAKQEQGRKPREKKDPNEPQALFDMMDKTMTKIRSVDMSVWTDEDKTNFWTAINSLRTGIDNYLAAPPSQPSRNLA
jgi:ParB family chromosome partitioning protein